MTKSTGQRRMWTEEDTITARRLFNRLQSYKAVGDVMGRSGSTVQEWLQGLRGGMRRKEIESSTSVPPELIQHRDRRLATAPRDITAMLMGDPLPGYSALDRR